MKRIFAALGLSVLVTLAPAGVAVAADQSGSTGNANVSRAYTTKESLKTGMITSFAKDNTTLVEAANTANASRIAGVVVSQDDSLIAVNPDDGKVQITSSGHSIVLVSTVNGAIKAGDPVAVSPFSGIGMKLKNANYIIGYADNGFSGQGTGVTTEQVKDKSGKATTIQVGSITVSMAPGYYSKNNDDQSENGAQKFVHGLTGHYVSMTRIWVSFGVVLLTVVSVIVLVYAAIYGSIISIGRNPLAKVSVLEALTRVIILAALAVALALALVYLLLR